MKKFLLSLIVCATVVNSMPLDTNVFKYFPLNVSNRWTWYVYRTYAPGPSYKSLNILTTQFINNHVYYLGRSDEYIFYGNQHLTWNVLYRIDSLNGNLYMYDTQNNIECLSDSLNSQINDSARISCESGNWYRYDTSSYNIFNQNFPTKVFSWTNYFEVGGNRKYAKNIGWVYSLGQAMMSQTIMTLRGCLINGVLNGDTNIYLGINQISSEVPDNFSLSQNFPNPFNPTTTIRFAIPSNVKSEMSNVKIIIYDALGREVQTLVNENISPGTYEVDFDGSNMPSGVYYYKLEVSEPSAKLMLTETKKMVLLK